jgi:hypothetical protein
MRKAWTALLLVAVCAACGRNETPSTANTSAATSARGAEIPLDVRDGATIVQDAEHHAVDASDAARKTACERLGDEIEGSALKLPKEMRAMSRCFPHPGGGWVELGRQAPNGPPSYFVELAHVADEGTLVRAKLDGNIAGITPTRADVAVYEGHIPLFKDAYDFDHDGVPEVWLQRPSDSYSRLDANALFTLHHGKITLYAPAKGLSAFTLDDVDHDGIPDLVYRLRLEGGGDACGAPIAAVYSPPFLGHAKANGAFVFDDPLAQKAARLACPSAPTKPLPQYDARDIMCARAWGAPANVFAHFEPDAKACDLEVESASNAGEKRDCGEGCDAMRTEAEIANTMPEIGLHAETNADGGSDAGGPDARD